MDASSKRQPIRCWQLANGSYLLQGAAHPLPAGLPEIRLPHGEAIQQGTPFYIVTIYGEVAKTYRLPWAYRREDWLVVNDLYRMVNGSFCRCVWSQQESHDAQIHVEAVGLGSLVECDASALPFNIDDQSLTPIPRPDGYCSVDGSFGLSCNARGLKLLHTICDEEHEDERKKERIYFCPVCEGLYKFVLYEVMQQRNFDCESGWYALTYGYFKVGQFNGSRIPFPLAEACKYGDHGGHLESKSEPA